MSCLCGTGSCRQLIDGQDWRRPDLQQRYAGYFSWYLQRRIDTPPNHPIADGRDDGAMTHWPAWATEPVALHPPDDRWQHRGERACQRLDAALGRWLLAPAAQCRLHGGAGLGGEADPGPAGGARRPRVRPAYRRGRGPHRLAPCSTCARSAALAAVLRLGRRRPPKRPSTRHDRGQPALARAAGLSATPCGSTGPLSRDMPHSNRPW